MAARRRRCAGHGWPVGGRARRRLLELELPIVPIVVYNAAKVWPRGKVKFNPGPVDVEVLPPVSTANWSAETIDEHVAEIRSIFERKLAEGPPSVG